MIALTLDEIARIVDGRLADADPAAVVSGSVEFDSRQIGPGGLFLAFDGEHVDGHDFVGDALDRGAVAAIVSRPVAAPRIEVTDGFEAIAALAASVVRRLTDTTVVGVTGSSGKTSTKDLLARVLSTAGPTVAPPGSFNNELGHPYTVLRADASTRFLVLENSARNIGHIRQLTQIAPPRIAAVLNVGSAHLGVFGSREAIAQAKGELVEALPPHDEGGVAVLNADDPHVLAMRTRTSARVVTFGVEAEADVRARGIDIDELGRARFTVVTADGSAPVSLRLVGRHHVSNALATVAVALHCGLPLDGIAATLSTATPVSRWRMEVTERADGVVVINDAYNANPESMRAALQALASVHAARRARGGRSFAVLGQMAELGDDATAEHEELGRFAARLGVSRIVAVGDQARPILRGAALEGSQGADATPVDDVDAAVALLRNELRPGDVVLVKASRAASLERVALAIADDSVGTVEGSGGRGT